MTHKGRESSKRSGAHSASCRVGRVLAHMPIRTSSTVRVAAISCRAGYASFRLRKWDDAARRNLRQAVIGKLPRLAPGYGPRRKQR